MRMIQLFKGTSAVLNRSRMIERTRNDTTQGIETALSLDMGRAAELFRTNEKVGTQWPARLFQ